MLCGIVTFLAVEKFVRLAKGGDSHGGHAHSEGREHVERKTERERGDGNDVSSSARKRKGVKEKAGKLQSPYLALCIH